MTSEPCLYDLLDLPEDELQRLVSKASSRGLAQLMSAYPRAIGRQLLMLISNMVSPSTLEFLRTQMLLAPAPSYAQVREAERELIKLYHQSKI